MQKIKVVNVAKEYAKQFYNSKVWKDCRASYIAYRIAIDGGMCEECHSELGFIVHHKEMLTRDNINDTNITLNFNNLKYDCKACHDREDEHAFIKARNRRYEFDENGNILPLFRNNVAEGGKQMCIRDRNKDC